jgi:uncharacterized membrane protein YdjX (TVP38/TMEM64 family)
MRLHQIRRIFLVAWLLFLVGSFSAYLYYPGAIEQYLTFSAGTSLYLAYTIFLLLGCIRGFTLIPVTYFIAAGLLLFEPLPLFILTMVGIMVSSASVYFFSELLQLDEMFERKYQKYVHFVKRVLQKHEMPIIIGWSAFPFLPTDIICYVAGSLEIRFWKFILSIFIGEAVMVAVYVWGGQHLLAALHG